MVCRLVSTHANNAFTFRTPTQVDLQSPFPAFAHEVFARQKLMAATLSTKTAVAQSQTLEHPSLDPKGALPSLVYLQKVVRGVATFVLDTAFDSRMDAVRVFGGGEAGPGAQSIDVSEDFLQAVTVSMAAASQ